MASEWEEKEFDNRIKKNLLEIFPHISEQAIQRRITHHKSTWEVPLIPPRLLQLCINDFLDMEINEEDLVAPVKDTVESSHTPVSAPKTSSDKYDVQQIDSDDDSIIIQAADIMDRDNQSSFDSDVMVLDSVPNAGHIRSSQTVDLTWLDPENETVLDRQSPTLFVEVQPQTSRTEMKNGSTDRDDSLPKIQFGNNRQSGKCVPSSTGSPSVFTNTKFNFGVGNLDYINTANCQNSPSATITNAQTTTSKSTHILSLSQSTAQQSTSSLSANLTGPSPFRPLGPSQLFCVSPSSLTFSPNIGSVILTPFPGSPMSSHYYLETGNMRPQMTISAFAPPVPVSSQKQFQNKLPLNTNIGQPQVSNPPKVNTSIKSDASNEPPPRLLSKTTLQHRTSNKPSFLLGPLPPLEPSSFSESPLSAPEPVNMTNPSRGISGTQINLKGGQNVQQPAVWRSILQGNSHVDNGVATLGASAIDAMKKTIAPEKTLLHEKLVQMHIPKDDATKSVVTSKTTTITATDMGVEQRHHTKSAVGPTGGAFTDADTAMGTSIGQTCQTKTAVGPSCTGITAVATCKSTPSATRAVVTATFKDVTTAGTDLGKTHEIKTAVSQSSTAVNATAMATSTCAVTATTVNTTVTCVRQQNKVALNATSAAITATVAAVEHIAETKMAPKTAMTVGEIVVQNQTNLVGTSGSGTAARQTIYEGTTVNGTSFCAVANVAYKIGAKHVIAAALGNTPGVQTGHSFPTSATGAGGNSLPHPKCRPLPAAAETSIPANIHAMQPALVKGNHLEPQITQQTTPSNIPATSTTTAVAAPKDPYEGILQEVMVMFPDVDPSYVLEFLRGQQNGFLLNAVCNYLLETNYPKVKNSTETPAPCTATVVPTIDYYKDYKSVENHHSKNYRWQCTELLTTEFKWMAANTIQNVMKLFRHCYAPTHKALKQVWKTAMEKVPAGQSPAGVQFTADIETENGRSHITVRLLKNSRKSKIISSLDPQLQQEVDFVKLKNLEELEEVDYQLALKMNENEYEQLGQQIECGCCYGEFAFESLVQCYDGHLFCGDCLQKYAEESVFGQGKAELSCMTDSCKATFPLSQLMRALPSNIFSKYEDRIQEENINLADLEDLVRCPFCDFAALMDSRYTVFSCQNSSCMKESCRHCQAEWSEHFGKKCIDMEKKDETKLRLEFEEKMTLAKIRVCHKCKTKFTKIDGCNKMTCRCLAKMCYICRKPDIDYNHFCRHPRDPGKPCDKCENCSLWTNPDSTWILPICDKNLSQQQIQEDDDRAVKEIQLEANKIRKEKGFMEEKLIGAPEEPPVKKIKT